MKYNKMIAILVCVVVCFSFVSCNTNDASKTTQSTTKVQEDYSSKTSISAAYFAEKATVGGFEAVNGLKSDDKDINGYYTIYFGGDDYGEFLEAKTREFIEEYYTYMKQTLITDLDGYTSEVIDDVDEGNYKKYSRILTSKSGDLSKYQFVILIDNTAFFATATTDEMARYNNLIKEINY